MSAPASHSSLPAALADRRFWRGWWLAAAVCGGAALIAEAWRWSDAEQRVFAFFGVLSGAEPDWAPYLPFVLLLPVLWWRRPRGAASGDGQETEEIALRRSRWGAVGLSLGVAVVALGMSRWVESAFVDDAGRPFPPAYHDEYSYLFQTETFLAGRTFFPGFEPRPELFDQMHVLNLGRFASRYFPGVGVWLMPFVAVGDPWLGQAIAHAICAGLLVWIGRELRGNLCGAVAGLLFAVSPGLAVFSTLLLAHHPTLLGLLVFLLAFLKLMRQPGVVLAVVAGAGLAYAMLCRPMTAAGFALPFGVWTVWYLLKGRSVGEPGESVRQRWRVVLALTSPLVAGLAVLLWYSWTITGDPFVSPYQLYTDVYTPRHVYGFNNVERGEQHLGERVVQNYDEWAENLTPPLALHHTGRRLIASWRLTLGIVPIGFAMLFLLVSGGLCGRLWLLVASIVSLFAVHVPYWFVGIMEWHYVLEASPLWLLLCGAATSDLMAGCRRQDWFGPVVWWGGVVSMAVAVNTLHVPLASQDDSTWWLWRARLPRLIGEVGFARGRYAAVAQEVDRLRQGRNAVLLVIPDPSDRSLDYVTNDPALTGEVLRVRTPAGESDPAALTRLAALFPDRVPFVFDAAAGRIGVVPAAP